MNLLKCALSYEKPTAPSFPSHESNTEPLAPNTSTTNGSPLALTSYGMLMHTFVSLSQPPPPGTRPALDTIGPSTSHLGQSRYIADHPTYFTGQSNPTQACTQITQVAPYTAGPTRCTPGSFGPVVDHLAPYDVPSGYITNRSTCFIGMSDPAHRPPRSHRTRPEYSSTTLDNLTMSQTNWPLTLDRPGTELYMQHHIWPNSLDMHSDCLARSQTVWPLTPDFLGMRKQNQELHNMHSSRTHHNNTTMPHRQHIITMSCHLMYIGSNILQPPESPRDIGHEVVALI